MSPPLSFPAAKPPGSGVVARVRPLGAMFCVSIFCLAALGRADEPSDDQVEFFEARIRPILVEHCYECHNSSLVAEGELSLDWQGGLAKGSQSGEVLGRGKDNLLLRVVRHEIEGLEMPDGAAKLNPQAISDLEKWIEMGAPDPRTAPPTEAELTQATSWQTQLEKRKLWWSFQPITPSSPPTVHNTAWPRDPIDQFVLRRLESAELEPSEPADRVTLIRRLYYALLGLPPGAAEIQAFVEDTHPEAYSRLVDSLLDSPHFGERWARHWMDWVRYADSHGSEGDPVIDGAYHYRDYLIRALNGDVPYDQLLREHIAGDQLPRPRINEALGINESIVGTAHWRFVFHGFAPTDALDEKVRFNDDAVNVLSKAFMGLTVSCARCHNHKFDAISQADYYAMYGIVSSARPGRAAIDLPSKLNAHTAELLEIKQQLRSQLATDWLHSLQTLPERVSVTKQEPKPNSIRAVLAQWMEQAELSGAGQGSVFTSAVADAAQKQADYLSTHHPQHWDFSAAEQAASWFAYGESLHPHASSGDKPHSQASRSSGPPRASQAGEFAVSNDAQRLVAGVYPSGVISNLVSDKLPARLTSPDFRLDGDYQLWLQVRGGGSASARYVIQDYPRNGTVFPVKNLTGEGSDVWHWQNFDLQYWKGDSAHIELAAARDGPLLVRNSDRSWFGIRQAIVARADAPAPPESLEHLQPLLQAAMQSPSGEKLDPTRTLRDALKDVIAAWQTQTMTDSQALFLDACLSEGLLPNSETELPNSAACAQHYRQAEQQIPVATRIPSLAEWQGHDHPMYDRGDHKKPGELVPRRFLEAIDARPYETRLSGRLELSDSLLQPRNPLTSRVIVNRIWHHLFGQGIVTTPDNFGQLGTLPTHPHLLDYLAAEFSGQQAWSMKQLIRRIVLSSTWMQRSTASQRAQGADPGNALLSHANVRRLDAEAIRDSLLLVAGSLSRQRFGPPVSGESPRRSLYVQAKRNSMDPFLTAFNSPVPFTTTGRRDATNVPAQSLMLMNSALVGKLATELAELSRLPQAGAPQSVAVTASVPREADARHRISRLWLSVLGRPAQPQELAAAQKLVADLDASYAATRRSRAALLKRQAKLASQIDNVLDQAGRRWAQKQDGRPEIPKAPQLAPIAAWSFAQPADSDAPDSRLLDSVAGSKLKLRNSAKLSDDALILDGQGWAESQILSQAVGEKTLMAIVELARLDQTGGGVLTLQTRDGGTFDSIVYAEKNPATWLSGSNNHLRTEPFAGAAAEKTCERVHIAITYAADGTVRGFRNGEPYGQAYQTQLHEFKQKTSRLVLGMRHGTGLVESRMLQGKVYEAKLFDVALSAEQVRAAYEAKHLPTRSQLLLELSEAARQELLADQAEQADIASQLEEQTFTPTADQAFIDLARSLLNLKEFIYVR